MPDFLILIAIPAVAVSRAAGIEAVVLDLLPIQTCWPADGGPFAGRRRQRLKASGFRHLTTAPALAAGGRAL